MGHHGAFTRPLLRLSIALGASIALHAWLIYSVAVSPSSYSGDIANPIIARLEPLGPEREPQVVARERNDTPSAARSEPQQARRKSSAQPAPAQRNIQTAENERAALMAPTPDDSTYYPAARLDVFPRELSQLKPIFPDRAEADGVRGGEVTLLLMIDDQGTVTDAAVAEAKPDGYFEQSALAWALERARFSPAQRNGRNVKCRVLVRVSYSPEARQAEGR